MSKTWTIGKLFLFALAVTLFSAPVSRGDDADPVPDWLLPHVGYGDDQIAPVILERARALYRSKTASGAVSNPCYFAMDATRPHKITDGVAADRFYVICEPLKRFRAISAGHGSGLKLPTLDFTNGKHCAKNFSTAIGSLLTTGGPYLTGELTDTFKGAYALPDGSQGDLIRTFVSYYGEGETENARARDLGGHSSQIVHVACWKKEPQNPHADAEGLVPFGTFENYPDGRSNGCTNWNPKDAPWVEALMRDQPTTLYIYPESADIRAVVEAARAGQSGVAYWNADCLREIQEPKFWPKDELEPLIAKWEAAKPKPEKKLCNGADPLPGNGGDEGRK